VAHRQAGLPAADDNDLEVTRRPVVVELTLIWMHLLEELLVA
jgi:hypothetical protein